MFSDIASFCLHSKLTQFFIPPKYAKDEFLYDCYCCVAKALGFLNNHKMKILACGLLPLAYRFYLIPFIAADAKIFSIFTAIIIIPISHFYDKGLQKLKKKREPAPTQLAVKVFENKMDQYLKELSSFSKLRDQCLKSKVDEAFEKKDLRILREAWFLQRRLLLELVDRIVKDLKDFSRSNGIPLSFNEIENLCIQFKALDIYLTQSLWDYREDVREKVEPYFEQIICNLTYKLTTSNRNIN